MATGGTTTDLKAVPVNLRALEGRLVIMLTPSVATVLIPEVPAPITVVGARIMLLGASRTKPVPKNLFIMANILQPRNFILV